jgi:hypothetical protein
MDIDEKRISDFAYYIWQSEGEPEGEEVRHWEMARKLAEAESSSAPVHVEETFTEAASNSNDAEAGPQSGNREGTSGDENALNSDGQVSRP